MGKIGYGYGSEWHLLRHLGYHRKYLSQKVLSVTGGSSVDWLDFQFSKENRPLMDDREFLGLEFIQDIRVQEKWKEFWPQTGTSHNWDAIGQICFDNQQEWLLVEAKGHIGELTSKCGARSKISKQKISSAFRKTSHAFGNQTRPVDEWFEPYYQYANRLAVLYFLMQECSPAAYARLLFIYFYGENMEGCKCPQMKQEWLPEIQAMNAWLGIEKNNELARRVHYLFLPVNPDGEGMRSSR